jgi:hypothetical protein
MDLAFACSNQFYHHSPYQKRFTWDTPQYISLADPGRIQNVQIGYADGTEKSYIYPYLYLDYPVEGESPMLVCGTKPNNEKAVVFKENSKRLSKIKYEITHSHSYSP